MQGGRSLTRWEGTPRSQVGPQRRHGWKGPALAEPWPGHTRGLCWLKLPLASSAPYSPYCPDAVIWESAMWPEASPRAFWQSAAQQGGGRRRKTEKSRESWLDSEAFESLPTWGATCRLSKVFSSLQKPPDSFTSHQVGNLICLHIHPCIFRVQ